MIHITNIKMTNFLLAIV